MFVNMQSGFSGGGMGGMGGERGGFLGVNGGGSRPSMPSGMPTQAKSNNGNLIVIGVLLILLAVAIVFVARKRNDMI